LQVGVLLGGAIVTEYVFSYPGLGRLILEGISKRDFPIVQASVVLIASIVASINLLVDLLYVFLDPRIRYE
jgi:peptide/nickel transport system permease protein